MPFRKNLDAKHVGQLKPYPVRIEETPILDYKTAVITEAMQQEVMGRATAPLAESINRGELTLGGKCFDGRNYSFSLYGSGRISGHNQDSWELAFASLLKILDRIKSKSTEESEAIAEIMEDIRGKSLFQRLFGRRDKNNG